MQRRLNLKVHEGLINNIDSNNLFIAIQPLHTKTPIYGSFIGEDFSEYLFLAAITALWVTMSVFLSVCRSFPNEFYRSVMLLLV